jgi:hypothetical protein
MASKVIRINLATYNFLRERAHNRGCSIADVIGDLLITTEEAHDRINKSDIIRLLQKTNCPENILNPLVEWINQPVVNDFKLRQWKELCLVK